MEEVSLSGTQVPHPFLAHGHFYALLVLFLLLVLLLSSHTVSIYCVVSAVSPSSYSSIMKVSQGHCHTLML